MTAGDTGRTLFQDGMRVAREHLDHLQDTALDAGFQAREAAGPGRVCSGFRVEAAAPGSVTVGPGLAFDRQDRPISLDAARTMTPDFGAGTRVFMVLTHLLRSRGLENGVPTLLYDDAAIETRTAAPPYQDDGVVFAQLDKGVSGIAVTQSGDWFLPPLDHGHRGIFLLREGRWRFDGHPLGLGAAAFDSGFVPVEAGAGATLVHGLQATDLMVQMQSRRPDGVVTTAGLGQSFWYELADPQQIRLVRGPGTGALDLRVTVWPLQAPGAGPVVPLADAGPGRIVDSGVSFTLDGSLSRAFGGRHIVKYIWTQMS